MESSAFPSTEDKITISPRSRMQAAMVLAILADALQIFVFPLFIAGAASPADDALDVGVGAVLTYLLGWHWEFLPSFAAKLVPGVDFSSLSGHWRLQMSTGNRRRTWSRLREAAWSTLRPPRCGGRERRIGMNLNFAQASFDFRIGRQPQLT